MRKILLPFTWQRLDQATRMKLDFHRACFLSANLLVPITIEVREPSKPNYCLFTSINGVRAAMAQPWFQDSWIQLPTFILGPKASEFAKDAGFHVVSVQTPPATQILPMLPRGTGIWFSGQDIAHDLVARAWPNDLQRLISYKIEIDVAEMIRVEGLWQTGRIDAALITSARVLDELAKIEGKTSPRYLAVLSSRLEAWAREIFPDALIHLVTSFEAGALWLLNIEDPSTDMKKAT